MPESNKDLNKNALADEASLYLDSLDLSLFSPDIRDDLDLGEALMHSMRKILCVAIGVPLASVLLISVFVGSCAGALISLFVALVVYFILFEGLLYERFFDVFTQISNTLQEKRAEALSVRIENLESRIGGIVSVSEYLDTDNVNTHTAASWLAVLKQSSDKKEIVDHKAYYQVLCNIRERLNQHKIKQKRAEIEKSITSLIK